MTAAASADRAHAYAALAQADQVLGRLVTEHGMPDPFRFDDGGRTGGSNFAAMVLHVLGQQISIKVAFVLYDRLVDAVGGAPTPEGVLALGAERIKALGTSRSKAGYLIDLAEHVASGRLPIEAMEALSDQDAVAALVAVRGIGAWSAEMFLIHQLHRPDVLPAADVGIRNAVITAYGLDQAPSADQIRSRGAAWAPYRTYAAALLWHSLGPRGA